MSRSVGSVGTVLVVASVVAGSVLEVLVVATLVVVEFVVEGAGRNAGTEAIDSAVPAHPTSPSRSQQITTSCRHTMRTLRLFTIGHRHAGHQSTAIMVGS
jgi:hypothetical protein